MFINGFDSEKQVFCVADFFNGKLEFKELSYMDMRAAVRGELQLNPYAFIIVYKYF